MWFEWTSQWCLHPIVCCANFKCTTIFKHKRSVYFFEGKNFNNEVFSKLSIVWSHVCVFMWSHVCVRVYRAMSRVCVEPCVCVYVEPCLCGAMCACLC